MILLALISWIIVFYLIIDKHIQLNSWILKGCVSLFFTFTLTSFSYFLSLIGHLSFSNFQITFGVIPILLLIYFFSALKLKINKEQKNQKISNALLIILFSCFIVFTWNFFRTANRWGEWDSWAIWALHAKFLTFENS